MLCMICDDQKSELEMMQKIISDYAGEHPDLFLAIQCFSNPFDMLEEMSRSGAPDIALLDICMPGVLGTEAAREIQSKSGGTTDIIFLTTSPGFAVKEAIPSSPLLLRIQKQAKWPMKAGFCPKGCAARNALPL